jgi:AcrR family transcriptional regulator
LGTVAPLALADHYRAVESLSIAQIAERLGRSPTTIKTYFYDPTGEQARAVKARYQGVCRCGAYTQPRNGKGDAYAYCKACHPGAIECRWTRRRVLDAIREWRPRYGQLPSSYDWSRTHAHRRGGEALARLSGGDWPAASVVTGAFGSWRAARASAMKRIAEARDTEEPTAGSSCGGWDPPAVSDRQPGDRGHRGTAAWERGSELGTPYLEAMGQTPLKRGERSVVRTQVGEQLEQHQRRARPRALVWDRSLTLTVELVPRFTPTEHDACASLFRAAEGSRNA